MARKPIEIKAIKHKEEKRKNIPTAEMESVVGEDIKTPIPAQYERRNRPPYPAEYERRNRDLDPQLVWRGKDEQDKSKLVVPMPPLYIQEKVQPKVIIDDLWRATKTRVHDTDPPMPDLFADFNGLPDLEAVTEFYQHDQNWSNRMIAGDSLKVMASLAEREGLRGKVQCIYIDPPYGIKFNSNFQWSVGSRDVKDGDRKHLTREREQVKAFRDTWKDDVHSYLSYLRDRLTVARDLLHNSGSVFVQIGDENVHRVRVVMDEVFGKDNFVNQINFRTSSGTTRVNSLKRTNDYILWYAKDREQIKFRRLVKPREISTRNYNQLLYGDLHTRSMTNEEKNDPTLLSDGAKAFRKLPLHSMSSGDHADRCAFGKKWGIPDNRSWRHALPGFERLLKAARIQGEKTALASRYFHEDYPVAEYTESWGDTGPEINKSYVVQTSTKPIERCILMTTDPGDLVLDPTCGSGTTAFVAENWGRRWIMIDTSRVALALARSGLMGAHFDYFVLADSPEGQQKEAELARTTPKTTPTHGNINLGFVYNRVPHITLDSITKNAEIDVIWEQTQPAVENALAALNTTLRGHKVAFPVESGGRAGKNIDFTAKGMEILPSGEEAPANGLMEWEVPHEPPPDWSESVRKTLSLFWKAYINRQKRIDESISAQTTYERLYDQPCVDATKLRVSGPFTVESLSPHRSLTVDADDELVDEVRDNNRKYSPTIRHTASSDFTQMVLENLKRAGAQQTNKEDRITFNSIVPWPGQFICAEGIFLEGEEQKRAGIFVGSEFGTVSRRDLVDSAREAADAKFTALIACAYNFDAHSSEFSKLGSLPVLRARMNPDLQFGTELAGSGNLFVIFGEPDISIESVGNDMVQIKVYGVDVFKPQTGEVVSTGSEEIALWMIDTDYNSESFFVRHAYFLGTKDPYNSLKSSLETEIDREAWESLHSDTSRPFPKPTDGLIAVKVINHLGDEVMKVFRV